METELPIPPVPEDADLRSFPGFMIDVQRLLKSDLAAFGDPAANWYNFLTWCAAFHHIPAGSLPDDDAKIAYLVGLGRDIRTWAKMRKAGALKGWVKHADGRLYHPVVTQKVLELLGKSKKAKDAIGKRWGDKNRQDVEIKGNTENERISQVIPDGYNKTEQNRTEDNRTISPSVLPSVGHLPLGEQTPTGHVDLLGEPAKAKPAAKTKPAQATRIPADWEANQALRRFGLDQLGDVARLDREIDKFRDFWKAKAGADARKMDWDATFKNWCRRAAEEQPRHGQRTGNSAIVVDGKPKPPGEGYRLDIIEAATGPLESVRSRRAVDPLATPRG